MVEISGINFSYYSSDIVYRITDQIKLLSNNTNNNYIYSKIIFIYNPRNSTLSKKEGDYTPYTCFKFGLRLPEKDYDLYRDYEINLLGQFKRNNLIKSHEWFIEYETENNNAKLIIGISPHLYNSKKYNESNLRQISGFYRDYNYKYWNFNFDSIYMKNYTSNKRKFLDFKEACLVPSLNVIKGTYEYQKYINDTLFSELIKEKKCFEEYELENDVFYCDNTKEIKNHIKKNFLKIVFYNMNLEEEFILTYDDLFIEKGNKIYFLVVFDYSNSLITWIIGKPFLKKYFFSYNYNNRIMTYYKITIVNSDKNLNDEGNNWIVIIIILFLFVIFCTLGFFLGKYFYDDKKRKNATELDDDFSGEGNQEINNGEGLLDNRNN